MKTINTKCFAPKIDCLCWDEYPIHVHKYISIIFTKKFKKSPFLPFTRMKLMILFPIRYFVVMSRVFCGDILCVFNVWKALTNTSRLNFPSHLCQLEDVSMGHFRFNLFHCT